jgi:hypothetical protein
VCVNFSVLIVLYCLRAFAAEKVPYQSRTSYRKMFPNRTFSICSRTACYKRSSWVSNTPKSKRRFPHLQKPFNLFFSPSSTLPKSELRYLTGVNLNNLSLGCCPSVLPPESCRSYSSEPWNREMRPRNGLTSNI